MHTIAIIPTPPETILAALGGWHEYLKTRLRAQLPVEAALDAILTDQDRPTSRATAPMALSPLLAAARACECPLVRRMGTVVDALADDLVLTEPLTEAADPAQRAGTVH